VCVELHVGKYLYSSDVFKILDTVNKVSDEKKNNFLLFLCKLNHSAPLVIGQPVTC